MSLSLTLIVCLNIFKVTGISYPVDLEQVFLKLINSYILTRCSWKNKNRNKETMNKLFPLGSCFH